MRCIKINNNQCVLSTCDIPRPSQEEILIKIAYAGINRPDLFQKLGLYPPPSGASDIPGLEISGTVVQGNKDFKEGETVCALLSGGGYADYATAPIGQCLKIPQGWSLEEAAALPETLFTVWANIGHLLPHKQTLLVHGGSSGIGSIAIQMGKAYGLKVVTTVRTIEKSSYCRSLGADITILYPQEDYQDIIEKSWGKNSIDIVLDMVGAPYFEKNIELLAFRGHHITIATLGGANANINLRTILKKNLTLSGSTLRNRSTQEKARLGNEISQNLNPFLEKGLIKPHIHTVFPLEEAENALKTLEKSDHLGKIILKL